MQFFRLQNSFEKSLRKFSEDDRGSSSKSRKGSETESLWKTPRSEVQLKKALHEPTLGMLQLLTYDPDIIDKRKHKMRLQSVGESFETDVPILLSTGSFDSKLYKSTPINPRNSGWGRRATESCLPSPSLKSAPVRTDVPLPQAPPPAIPVSRQIINPHALAQLFESEASRFSTFTAATESSRWDESNGNMLAFYELDTNEPVRQFSIASLHGSHGSEEFANIAELMNPNYRYITIEENEEEEVQEQDVIQVQEPISKKDRVRDTFGMQDFIARQQAAAKRAENADYQDFAKFLALPDRKSKETYALKVRTSSETARANSTDSTSPVSPTTLRNTTSFGSVSPRKKSFAGSSHDSQPSITSIASGKSTLRSSFRPARRQSAESFIPTMPKRVTTFGPEPFSLSSTASTLVTPSQTIPGTVDVQTELSNLAKLRKEQETIMTQATRIIEQIQRTETLILKQIEEQQKKYQEKDSSDSVQVIQKKATQDLGDKSFEGEQSPNEQCEVIHESGVYDTTQKDQEAELLKDKIQEGHRLTFWWDDEVDHTYKEEHHDHEVIQEDTVLSERAAEIESVRPLFDNSI